MKKAVLVMSIILMVFLSACGKQQAPAGVQDDPQDGSSSAITEATTEKETIDITEKFFVTFINDIYTNTPEYLGKTIKIEGMFKGEYFEPTKKTYYYVYRTGPGCCGNDGSMCGFEFTYDEDMPVDNDWIEVVGTLRTYEEEGYTYLTLDADRVTVLDTRGAETVFQ
jgi:putative membrane protein